MNFDKQREDWLTLIEMEFDDLRLRTNDPVEFSRWAAKAASRLADQVFHEAQARNPPPLPKFKWKIGAILLATSLALATPARSQEAVIDVAAIAKAIEAITLGQNQLAVMKYQSNSIGLTGVVPIVIGATVPPISDLGSAQVSLDGQPQPAGLSLPAARAAVGQFLQPTAQTVTAADQAAGQRQAELVHAAADGLARSIRTESIAQGDPAQLAAAIGANQNASDLRTQIAGVAAIQAHQAATLDEIKTLLAAILRVESDKELASAPIQQQ
jgi:hypothetical protein